MTCSVSSHAVALATAMAVSGTLIFLVICRQRPPGQLAGTDPPPAFPRPCIAGTLLLLSLSKRSQRRASKTGGRRVHFAERVMERYIEGRRSQWEEEEDSPPTGMVEVATPPGIPRVCGGDGGGGVSECRHLGRGVMPANWVALYSGMLRDRNHRVICSY
ncbi:unnamed protein product [Spirodela intermedia]|uniref:Uncharacterized protein n=1 Tax=Spirodela intermedia TaxID=51605 RepID=A0A7I8LJN4_SPIIN|nr:unnamed protein product [Spirodela intermedia]